MICLHQITKEHLEDIARAFAASFSSDDGIIPACMNEEEAFHYFFITLDAYQKRGKLYALSEKEEAYCVYYRKNKGLPWYMDLVLMYRYMRAIPARVMQKMLVVRQGWTDYTVYHFDTKDFVDVCLVCVRREYQGQGYLRKLLAQPFAEAAEAGIPCILDTDTPLKAAKYGHAGMRIEKDAVLKSGIHMYTMIRD